MTLKQMAQSALDVQSACNLSGVVHSFAQIVHAMRTEHGFDTPTCNKHPICYLFSVQIAHLTGSASDAFEDYSNATDACNKLAAEYPELHEGRD